MSDSNPLTNISGNSLASLGMFFLNSELRTTVVDSADLADSLDWEEEITENLKEAKARGVKIDPEIEELLRRKVKVTIDDLYPFRDAGIVFAKGATTTLPCLTGSQEYIQFTEPRFTIGELVDFKRTGDLSYVVGIEFVKEEFDAKNGVIEWFYTVLPVNKVYDCDSKDTSFEYELNKISILERPLIPVNFPQARIGDLIENKSGVCQIITEIEWNCQIDLKEINSLMEKDNINLNPFYIYSLTEWDKEKKELKEDYKEKCLELAPKFSKPY